MRMRALHTRCAPLPPVKAAFFSLVAVVMHGILLPPQKQEERLLALRRDAAMPAERRRDMARLEQEVGGGRRNGDGDGDGDGDGMWAEG
mgnify:CR=1 FL=1